MANRKKSARRQRLEAAIVYPLAWLEERSGLIGGVRYFLFRKVPADTNWMQTLGSATLTAFIVQAVTGVILAMFYRPTPTDAYKSIQHITDEVTMGWLVRGMHKWGASCFIILMFLHMLLIPGAIIGLITLHLYLVIRLGVTSPPWSKEAAGMVRDEEPSNLRAGLIRPSSRNGGSD